MHGLELVKKLKPCRFEYNWIDNDKKIRFGFVAQDIEEVLPFEDYGILRKDKDGFFMVDYGQLIAPIVKALQEQQIEIEILEKRIERLGG